MPVRAVKLEMQTELERQIGQDALRLGNQQQTAVAHALHDSSRLINPDSRSRLLDPPNTQ